MKGLFLILLGLGIIIFSRRKIASPIISRMFNEGFLTPQQPKPEKAEIFKHAGPNLSLYILGAILIFVGIIIILY